MNHRSIQSCPGNLVIVFTSDKNTTSLAIHSSIGAPTRDAARRCGREREKASVYPVSYSTSTRDAVLALSRFKVRSFVSDENRRLQLYCTLSATLNTRPCLRAHFAVVWRRRPRKKRWNARNLSHVWTNGRVENPRNKSIQLVRWSQTLAMSHWCDMLFFFSNF